MTVYTVPPEAYNGTLTVSGGDDITGLSTMPAGTTLTLLFSEDAEGRGLVNGGTLILSGDFVYRSPDSISLISDGFNAVEVGRSINSNGLLWDHPGYPTNLGINPTIDGSAFQSDIQTMIDQRIAAPVITIGIGGPTTAAATIRVNTASENGANATFSVSASSNPTAQAAALATAMTANTTNGQATSTFFKVTSSGGTVTLKPKLPYSSMRNVLLQIVSGSGVTWTNLDGTAVSTSAVAVGRAAMGGRVRMPAGLYDGQTGSQTPVVIDVPGTVIQADTGTVWRAAATGAFIIEAAACRIEGVEFLWEDDGGNGRNGQTLGLIAASDFYMSDCDVTVDGFTASEVAGGSTCNAFSAIQLPGVYPYHRSRSHRRMVFENCNFYLGNSAGGLFLNSIYNFDINGCLFTSLFGRNNPHGSGGVAFYDAPARLLHIQNSDYGTVRGCDFLNVGGNADAAFFDAEALIERTGSGVDGTHEGGHITVTKCRFHGTVDNYGAQLKLKDLWFARVVDNEFHRHQLTFVAQTPDPDPVVPQLHERHESACLLIQDSLQTTVTGNEFFNLGADGGDYAMYPCVAYLSLADFQGMDGGQRPKILGLHSNTYVAPVAASLNITVATLRDNKNFHPFFQHFCTDNGYPLDDFTATGNTLRSGGRARCRVAVTDNTLVGPGEGITLTVPPSVAEGTDNVGATTLTLTGGAPWSAGSTLTLTASASTFSMTDEDDAHEYVLTGADTSTTRVRVTTYTSATVVTVLVISVVPSSLRGVATAVWAVHTPVTIDVLENSEFNAASPSGGAHETAQAIAGFINGDATASTYIRAMVGESSYQDVDEPTSGGIVVIEFLRHGEDGNDITVTHVGTGTGLTVTVGDASPSTVAEGATGNLAGGFGYSALTGQGAFLLSDDNFTLLAFGGIGSRGPKSACIQGNSMIGFSSGSAVFAGTTEVINDWASSNVIV